MTGSYGEPSGTTPAATSPSATQRWMTAGEVSRESGLREDLLIRFVPTVQTPNGPLFGARQLGIARFVRQLAEIGTPASAVLAAVEDLNGRPDDEISQLAGQSNRRHATRPTRRRAGIVGVAVIAVLIGGLAGGLIGKNTVSDHRAPLAAPSTVTVSASPPPLQPAVPTAPDPVCAEWGPMNDAYIGKRAEWVKTDPNIPASQWSPEQRAITMNVIPGMHSEAAELRGIALKAADPVLRALLQLEALYQDDFADRLPNYSGPDDKRLWQAANDAGAMVNSLCHAMVRPK
jgi:hypothetical protein